MSKRESAFKPTPFASRRSNKEPMVTRGGSSGSSKEDSNRYTISDEVAAAIARLPDSVDELSNNETVDILTVHDLTLVMRAFDIPVTPVAESIKNKNRRDRSLQAKTKMLSLIASNVGDRWSHIHATAVSRRGTHDQKRRGSTSSSVRGEPIQVRGYDTFVNDTLTKTYKEGAIPGRDELPFLSDEDYAAACDFFRSTHVDYVDQNDEQDRGTEVCASQYIYGVVRETTAALESYQEAAEATSTYVGIIAAHFENGYTEMPVVPEPEVDDPTEATQIHVQETE